MTSAPGKPGGPESINPTKIGLPIKGARPGRNNSKSCLTFCPWDFARMLREEIVAERRVNERGRTYEPKRV
jgi:hypothetical protein